jgi:hypothetical protein
MSKESHYMLVNPYIEGEVAKLYKASTAEGAAKEAWLKISKYFAGNLPTFHITMSRVTNDSLHHFKVNEQKKGKNIDFSIVQHTVNLNADTLSRFKQNLENAKTTGMALKTKHEKKMSGGRPEKHRSKEDDDDESDDDDYYYRRKKIYAEQPIVYFWYDPTIYGVDKIWYPSLISPLFPPVEIALSYLPYQYLLPRVTYN